MIFSYSKYNGNVSFSITKIQIHYIRAKCHCYQVLSIYFYIFSIWVTGMRYGSSSSSSRVQRLVLKLTTASKRTATFEYTTKDSCKLTRYLNPDYISTIV